MNVLRKLSVLSFCLLASLGLSAQGIEFFHGSWEEALAKAEAEDKLIFVDAYAEWCGPCKRMAAQVFPLAEVGEFFNENFIPVKYDMEKAESKDFRQKHSVRAYPTLFFINGKNEVVHKTVGGKQADGLIAAGNAAMVKMDNVPELTARWEDGDRDPAFVNRYVRALVRGGEPHLKIANDYVRTQQDLTTPANLQLLLTAATDADSRLFDLLIANREAATALVGEEKFRAAVNKAVNNTKAKAVEFKDDNLMKTAVKKLALVDKDASKRLALEGAFDVAAAGSDAKAFNKALKKYLAKGVNDDPVRLQRIYDVTIKTNFVTNEEAITMAADAGARAAEMDPQGGFVKMYRIADLLLKQKRNDLALDYANRALNILPAGNPNYKKAIEGLIDRIQAAR